MLFSTAKPDRTDPVSSRELDEAVFATAIGALNAPSAVGTRRRPRKFRATCRPSRPLDVPHRGVRESSGPLNKGSPPKT